MCVDYVSCEARTTEYASRWLKYADKRSSAIKAYLLSPFLYGHAHQSDKVRIVYKCVCLCTCVYVCVCLCVCVCVYRCRYVYVYMTTHVCTWCVYMFHFQICNGQSGFVVYTFGTS